MKTIILNIALTLICILSSTTAIQAIKNFENNSVLAFEQLSKVKRILARDFKVGP